MPRVLVKSAQLTKVELKYSEGTTKRTAERRIIAVRSRRYSTINSHPDSSSCVQEKAEMAPQDTKKLPSSIRSRRSAKSLCRVATVKTKSAEGPVLIYY